MKKWQLIDYFDVWGNAEDGWEVQNQCITKNELLISESATDEEILRMLADIHYLKSSSVAKLEDHIDSIEIIAIQNDMPLGKLVRKEKSNV